MSELSELPSDLKELVRNSLATLGDVIKKREGASFYRKVETIRSQMVEYRSLSQAEKEESLQKLYKKLKREEQESKVKLVHSFSLMMEVINCCEASYRSIRLEGKERPLAKTPEESVIFVLTAHPTEARSVEILGLFRSIQQLFIDWFHSREESVFTSLASLLSFAWETPLTKHVKPSVNDEALHIYSTVLKEETLKKMIDLNGFLRLRLRSWVGGDKDGHPGVDEKAMLQSLKASRKLIIHYFDKWLNQYLDYVKSHSVHEMLSQALTVKKQLNGLQVLKKDDATHVNGLKASLDQLCDAHLERFCFQDTHLIRLQGLFNLFRGLVVPLEMREDSEVIGEALSSKKAQAIARMLVELKEISSGSWARYYVQGLIISMTTETQHLLNARELCQKYLKGTPLPIIPLFETEQALKDSVEILKGALENSEFRKCIREQWRNRLEVMVGYSDSSKGMGVLASRVFLSDAIVRLDQFIQSKKHIPIFFHGSGGSIDRGGGSIEEQTSWWPESALKTYKATIQGEMVDRSFATAPITSSMVKKIQKNYKNPAKKDISFSKEVRHFASSVSLEYQRKLKDPQFFEMLIQATPYSYLSALKMGSRPSKRKSLDSFQNIRAIPWILCWTQTRVLFPTWWGIGSTWKNADQKTKKALTHCYNKNPVFKSFMNNLGFTLAKIELPVWRLYLKELLEDKRKVESYYQEFHQELEATREFVSFVTGRKDLLWFRPWLKESINLRSSMIHPINMIQIQAFKDKDEFLIRKSVAGIASGMMTTG